MANGPLSTPGTPPADAGRLDAVAVTALTEVLDRLAAGRLPAAELRIALRPVVRAARDGGATVEVLLVELKALWAALPAARTASGTPVERARPLQRVVTLCIETYYEP